MAATAHPLSTSIASFVSTFSSVFPGSLASLRNKLARTGVERASAGARLGLSLSLSSGLGALVAASTLVAASSATSTSNASPALRLLLLLRHLCLSRLLRWLTGRILLVSAATTTASPTSCNWKSGQCSQVSAGSSWGFGWQR
ncbi:uncharacterized protein BDV17DRAFT_254901 [Aspergillus undulatus]|uniref:uncharacterized protein n=1 Tax=Aspergillus undulatus TaxID=1810928 RepID=UPI003CCE2B30